MEGEPKFARSQALPDFDYASYARVLGLAGIRIDDPAQIDDAWNAPWAPMAHSSSTQSWILTFQRYRRG